MDGAIQSLCQFALRGVRRKRRVADLGHCPGRPACIGGALAFGIAFVALVQRHRVLGRRRERAIALQAINQQAMRRLRREWDAVPVRHSPQVEAAHAYAADLDLFGHASLMHLLDTTGTSMGGATLARWLREAAPAHSVHERQRAMLELAPLLELRQELEASGGSVLDPEPFLRWAESEPWLRRRGWVVWAARVSPALLCLLGLAQLAGLIAGPWWAVFLFVNAFVWQRAGRMAYPTLSRIEHQQAAFQQYAASFDLLAHAHFEAPRLQNLLGLLTVDGRSASSQMRSLERTTRFVIPRSAQVYWVLQPILLWDVHVLATLEAWQVSNGARVRTWLETLGEVEALAAFAALAHAHPDWAVPEIDAHAERLDAEQAGHPLLPPDARVDNDVHVGPPATFLLVTGSNMAGKSTYLRTIGSNIVLAQAGGPVCARSWRMPPLTLWTSMRVVDSLEGGVSTFLAEVLRLKQVVDAARSDGGGSQRSVCFLLDEILQGTNTF